MDVNVEQVKWSVWRVVHYWYYKRKVIVQAMTEFLWSIKMKRLYYVSKKNIKLGTDQELCIQSNNKTNETFTEISVPIVRFLYFVDKH